MSTSANSETELLTEHFGYPPVSLIDDIINSVNVLAERALNSVEQGLLNASPATLGFKAPKSQSQQEAAAADSLSPAERARNEVEAGTHQLETLLCASIDRNFDKFEIYVLRNIFTVRPPELCNWIRLSHYDGLDFSSSAARRTNNHDSNDSSENHLAVVPSDAPTIESVALLRRRLRESMRLNALLTAERARNETLLQDLRRLVGDTASATPQVKTESSSPVQRRSVSRDVNANANAVDNQGTSGSDTQKKEETKSPFAFLHQKGDLASSGGGAAPLATTAAFALSQLQALRSLSTALSNITPDLKASSTSAAGTHDAEDDDGSGGPSTAGPRGWRRERVEYVETATRRHLETVHGLELGKHGEVRDGEWQGPGRSLARGEVEGIEHVVAVLGGDSNGVAGTEGNSSSGRSGGDEEPMDES
ncbi:Mis12 protein-domain-containing protein [Nemania sp. FL0031]|nr:Mis12 protein-domain-containing protein [Nemania sp. FL0031]